MAENAAAAKEAASLNATGPLKRKRRGRAGHSRWPAVWAAVTVAGGFATVLLHFLGLVINRHFLSAWGIDPNQFPKSTDWLLLNGYYGLWNGLAMLWLAFSRNFIWILLGSIALVLYIYVLFAPWNPFDKLAKKLGWFESLPRWTQSLAVIALIGSWLAVALWPVILFLFFAIGLPAGIGKTIGEDIVASHVKDYAKGCQDSKAMCIRILRGEQEVGEGYVLDTSSTHIAYFDVKMKVARILPKDGIELRATRLPAAP